MANLPELIPTGVIALAYRVTRGTVAVWARQGKLGPIVTSTGGRNSKALRSELDARLGPLSDAEWAEARRRYEKGEHHRPTLSRGDAS